MTENLPPLCMKITKEIMDNKLSMLFLEPFSPDKKSQADYNSKIKKPMDLSTILRKLKDNMYLSIQDWIDDLYLVFDNAIEFNGATSLVGGVAVYLKRQLDKRMKTVECLNIRNYEYQLIELNKLLSQTLLNPPASLSVECRVDIQTDILNDFTVERIEKLRKKLNEMIVDGKEEMVVDCLATADKNFMDEKTDQKVDIAKLGRRSLTDLENLVKENGY